MKWLALVRAALLFLRVPLCDVVRLVPRTHERVARPRQAFFLLLDRGNPKDFPVLFPSYGGFYVWY